MFCNNTVAEYLQKYYNLCDKDATRETYIMHDGEFHFGIHSWSVKERCILFLKNKFLKNWKMKTKLLSGCKSQMTIFLTYKWQTQF